MNHIPNTLNDQHISLMCVFLGKFLMDEECIVLVDAMLLFVLQMVIPLCTV